MKNVWLVTAGITSAVLLVATTAAAAPTIYATRAAFDTAFPGLPIETFQGLASNAGCPSPMSSTTPDNMCFTQGGLLAGFTVGGTDAHPTDGISLTDGPTGRFIKTSYYADTTVLTLSPAQFAVGFDMHLVGGGAVLLTDGTTATVTVYDDSAALVATQDVATGGFFGIRSDTRIATVKIIRNGTYAEGIDNLVFGPAFSSVTPATGGYRGGSSVTLTGAGLAASTTVTFDGVPATDIVVTGGTSLTCKAPAHAAGTVDVVLQTSGVSLTRASSFTYAAHSATVALTLTPKSPRYPDEPNAFTATVTGTDPQGTVTLMEGATELAQGSLASGTADFSVLLGVGTHNVFARYKGDPFHAEASSSETTVDVVEHPPPALDAGLGDGGGDGSDAGLFGDADAPNDAGTPSNSGTPLTPGAPLNPSDDAGAGGAANGGATESGCATSSESPRTPLGFAAALVMLVALAFVRRRSR